MNEHAKQPFFTTHWSVVLAAKGDGPDADGALRKLCDLYYRIDRYCIFSNVPSRGMRAEFTADGMRKI